VETQASNRRVAGRTDQPRPRGGPPGRHHSVRQMFSSALVSGSRLSHTRSRARIRRPPSVALSPSLRRRRWSGCRRR